jgi:adenosylcobinamide-GDP ribazoletransferase
LALPPHVAVLLSIAATAWLTGAFHEDGLADAVDGLGGSFDRDRALEIMRDSRIGTYGTLALVLVVGVKTLTLADFPPLVAAGLIVAAHAASRACAVGIMASLPYVRADASKAKPLVQQVSATTVGIAIATGAATLAGVALLGLAVALAAALSAAVVTLLWRRKLNARLGGYTGDCLGATQQLVEASIYVAALAAWSI